ncbi:MAG: hypothetical protein NVSMB6_28430 [Burkholderiaceae bacterium]
MNLDKIAKGDTVQLRVLCADWETVRSTVRMPLESSGEQHHETLGCVVDFPGLTHGQWNFLRPELDRLGIRYNYLDHSANAEWVRQL